MTCDVLVGAIPFKPNCRSVRAAQMHLGDLSTVVGAKSTCSSAMTGIAGIVGPVPQEPRVLNAGRAGAPPPEKNIGRISQRFAHFLQ